MIRNLVPVNTASRSERSANRSLYQGNCACARFSLPVRPFPVHRILCSFMPCWPARTSHRANIVHRFEPIAQVTTTFDCVFE